MSRMNFKTDDKTRAKQKVLYAPAGQSEKSSHTAHGVPIIGAEICNFLDGNWVVTIRVFVYLPCDQSRK